jgi:hypothetical protein
MTDAGGRTSKISDVRVVEQAFTSNITTDGPGIYAYDTSGSTVTVTVSSDDIAAQRVIVVKDKGGGAGTDAITVDTEGSENIDGSASTTISTDYGVLRLYSDGDNLFSF